jgi:hypothetical protein
MMKTNNLILFTSQAILSFMCLAALDFGNTSESYGQPAQQIEANSSANVATNASKVKLHLESLSITRSPTGLVDVIGSIRNNNSVNVDDIKVTAEYYDKKGLIIKSTDKLVTNPSHIAKPGDIIPFQMIEVISFGKVNTHNVTAHGDIVG